MRSQGIPGLVDDVIITSHFNPMFPPHTQYEISGFEKMPLLEALNGYKLKLPSETEEEEDTPAAEGQGEGEREGEGEGETETEGESLRVATASPAGAVSLQ